MFLQATFTLAATKSTATYTKIFYFRDGEQARQSLYNHYKSIDVLAPQMYGVDAQGELENELKHGDVITFAVSHGVKVMPLITNKGFSKASLAILDDKSMQEKLADELIAEAKANKYMGYQLDFEQIDLSYKDKYTSFVSLLYQALHKDELTLSVAVVAKISDNPTDYKNTLWQDLIGAYDYSALALNTDFISVMSYDDPDSKGPVARKEWLAKVIEYSMAHVPTQKISLGIGLYYWVWDNSREKLVGIGGYEAMKKIMDKYNPSYVYSSIQSTPYLTYVKSGKRYTMWYENGKSVGEKIALINKHGLHGFSAWALGLEVPSVYNVI